MATLLDEAINESKKDISAMPKYLPLSTAQNIETVSALKQKQFVPNYKTNTIERVYRGANQAIQQMADIAPALQLFGEETQLGLGGYFGAKEEFIDRKKANIATLQRNLVVQQQQRMQDVDKETADSWAFKIGQGVTNLGLMAIGGGATAGARALGLGVTKAATVGATAAILSAVPLENIEQQSDRIKFDDKGNVDVSNITPEWARKTVGGETFYMAGMGILESKFGIFKNLTQWQKPIPFKNNLLKNLSVPATTALKSFINEGTTEGLQSLLSSGIQLVEGNITLADIPDRLQQAWQEAIIGGLFGGGVGTAVGINQAHTVKQGLTEMVQPILQDPELTEQVVNAIYDSGTAEMTNVISRELELSSELNAKYGAIYDTMQGVIYDAINNAGAFEGVSEVEIAQYVSDTSKMFANQVLSEAHKRGVSIDGVLKASDIKFENGKIYMKAGKDIIAESQTVNNEASTEVVNQSTESDYSKRKKNVAYSILSKATGKSAKWLRMQLGSKSNKKGMVKRHEFIVELIRNTADGISGSDGMLPEWREFYSDPGVSYDNQEVGADYDLAMQALDDILNNNFKNPADEITRRNQEEGEYYESIIKGIKEKFDNAKNIDKLFELYDNELNELPKDLQENDAIIEEINNSLEQNLERLSDEERNQETEGRNTQEVSERNNGTNQAGDVGSNQNNINQTQGQNQEINPDTKLYQETDQTETEAFKKWFGDSKVVDEDGKPKIVYRGDVVTFDTFDKEKASTESAMGAGFYFSDNEADVESNYYNGGPDFDNKVARRAEQIQQEREDEGENIDYDEAKEIAEKELRGDSEPQELEVYLSIKNPVYVGTNETYLLSDVFDDIDINEEDYEDYSEYEEARQEAEDEAIQTISYEIDDALGGLLSYDDIERAKSILFEYLYDGGVTLQQLKDRLNEEYFENYETGDIVGNEVARRIAEALGYDGIIDDTVSTKFKNMGMEEGTTHYIAFEPNQIKSVDNQGTFDENNPNIYMQLKNTPKQPKIFKGAFDVSAKAIELFKDADYSTLPHELAHFWLDNMWGYYRSGKASEAYSNNFQGVLDWLGVKEGQINLTRAQQEKFARGYEKYLLNGYAPSGLIQGAFDDYDKWLQKVYNDARELKVKLTPDAIEFFDTMTTGELPEYDVPETQAQIREKNIEQMNKDIETARKFVVEKQAEYNNFDGGNVITKDTVPVTTEGEKKQSKAYTNQASILGIAEELNYNKADIAEQNKLASEYVKNNLDEARQVVNGEKEAPSDILKNAIYNAYLKEMLAIGDNEAYINALKNQSLELTRAGQEIASQRGAIENIFDSGYWIRRIENLKKSKLAAQKFGNGWTASEQEQALSKMNDFIKNKVEAVMSEFMEAEPEQQKKIAEKLSKDIASEFKVKPDTKLYQSMYEPSEVRTRTNAYNYIYKYINSALGLDLTKAQYNEIIAKTMAIQKSIETTRNRNGNPSALFFKNISEMENYANSIEPSPALAILTSTVGRGNMLFSPKTIALNIESNIVNFFTEAITRRIQSGAVNMAVDKQVIKDYLAYSREVFNTSGYQVSSMPTLDPTTQILSEKMTTTAGDRAVDKLGRFFEQTIFKYGLGAPDLFFKDMTFVDTANVLATKEAKGDTKKATELFKDICLIQPKTAKGKELREIAINEALVATYQNKGKTSDLALGIRNAINKASGSANLGDMLSPFVKTPANVIGLGFDYSMGGLVALKNIQTIYNDIQNGTFTETTRKSLRSLARNGIGFVAAAMISSLIDDDDYIPEYALLDAKQRELVKMKGGVFNSVKIGDKYISLDYFGPLAMPLVSFLNARRGYDAKTAAWNYFQGSAYQALKLPVIGDLKSLLEGTGRTLTKDIDTNLKTLEDAAIDFVSSRSIPAIVTDIAKMTDEYERETNNNAVNRLKSKLPVLREELPMQYNYGTGRARETQNPVSQLFAGARVKEEVSSPVIREIDKLNSKNTDEKVNIAKITKTGLLSSLSDEKKNKIEKEFAQTYATDVKAYISTVQYKNLDTGEKVKALNKIRNNIRDDIKVEYGLAKPKKRKRSN